MAKRKRSSMDEAIKFLRKANEAARSLGHLLEKLLLIYLLLRYHPW
jgi:hypothetical protein